MIAHPLARRLAVLVVLAGLATALWIGAVRPAIEWRLAIRAEAGLLQGEERRLRVGLARMARERAILQMGSLDGMIWQGAQAGAVTAAIQAELSAAAERAGLELQSIAPIEKRTLPVAQAELFRLEGEATLDRWLEFLLQIEPNVPLFAIETATFRRLSSVESAEPQPRLYGQIDVLAPIEAADASAEEARR